MLNNTSFLNFKSQIFLPKYNTNNKQAFSNIVAPKLVPLKQDTVNFKGVKEYKVALNNKETCKAVHDEAKATSDKLKEVLNAHFGALVYSQENTSGIIEPIRTRIKSTDSIEEKISNKISSIFESKNEKDIEKIFSPKNKEKIKENIKDICGARIVITKPFDEYMDLITESLCNMIEKENLIINEIENHVMPNKEKTSYFSKEQLKRIENQVNKTRKSNGLDKIEVFSEPSKSGYTALHLSLDTTQFPKLKKEQGYWSELQILGSDVELLKDVEDFCYKLKKGMGIKSADIAYTPFEKFFLNAYNDTKNYPGIKKAFEDYTKEAYKRQRDRVPSDDITDDTTNWAYKYPTITECGFDGKIPTILDFNVLARIKRDCDDLYKVEHQTQKIMEEINNPPKAQNNN